MKIHHDTPERSQFQVYGLLWDKKFRAKFNKQLKNKPLPILLTYGINNSISVEGYLQFCQHKDTIIAKYFVDKCTWIYTRGWSDTIHTLDVKKQTENKYDRNARSASNNIRPLLRSEVKDLIKLLGAEQWSISTIHFSWK